MRLNHQAKSKGSLQLDRSITFYQTDGKSRRKIAQRALRVRHFLEIGHFRLLSDFLVILRSATAALLLHSTKSFQNPEPELNKTSYASNSCYYARNADIQQTTLIVYPITKHTHGPMATNVRLNRLVKARAAFSLTVVLPLTRQMENRAEKLRSVLYVFGISWKLEHFAFFPTFG